MLESGSDRETQKGRNNDKSRGSESIIEDPEK